MSIVDSDAFLDMPLTTQLLYFHLNMRADDDGFIGNPKRIQKLIGSSEDDLKLLLMKRFILAFEHGVIVIKHWKMHNTIRFDRYTPTKYQEELSMLLVKDNKSYTLNDGNQMATIRQPNVATVLGLDLDSDKGIDKELKKKNIYGEFKNVKLTDEEYKKLEEKGLIKEIQNLDSYIESKGVKYKNHYATILVWDRKNKGVKNAENKPEPERRKLSGVTYL